MQFTVALATVLSTADAQIITFTGGVGCAVLMPSPPSDVHAEAGNGEVTLDWNPPDNGACVAEYVVDVAVVSDQRHFFDWVPVKTWEHRLVIRDLENGVKHKFSIMVGAEENDVMAYVNLLLCRSENAKVSLPNQHIEDVEWEGSAQILVQRQMCKFYMEKHRIYPERSF